MDQLLLYTYAHGKGCSCCDDVTGEAKRRFVEFEKSIPNEYIVKRKITSEIELAKLNKEQKALQQKIYEMGDDLIYIKSTKYNEFMEYMKSKLECGHCKNSVGKMMHCPCRKVLYCNEKCQRADWSAHKTKCDFKKQ